MWQQYLLKTKDNPPSRYLLKALDEHVQYLDKTYPALDLGSGAGRDTKLLVSRGFHVEAMDMEPEAEKYIIEEVKRGKAVFQKASFLDFNYKRYSLINASYALPFTQEKDFSFVWSNIASSLVEGGIFVGELFGIQDSWNKGDGRMNFHDMKSVERLLKGFEILLLEEELRTGKTALGSKKQWHAFHIIAQKPAKELPS